MRWQPNEVEERRPTAGIKAVSRCHNLLTQMRVGAVGFDTMSELYVSDPFFSIVTQNLQEGPALMIYFRGLMGFSSKGNQLCIP